MSKFLCPNDKKHPLRFESNGRGEKAFCNICKAHFVSYPKGSKWKMMEPKSKSEERD